MKHGLHSCEKGRSRPALKPDEEVVDAITDEERDRETAEENES